jgi:hypothetical protein
MILHELLSFRAANFPAYLRGLAVRVMERFAAETVLRAISTPVGMKISPGPFRG